jgi:hypothetical protein
MADMDAHTWAGALQVLKDMLVRNSGCVSSTALRRELERKGVADSRPVISKLSYFDPEQGIEANFAIPDFQFRHRGRSFYTPDALAEAEKATDTRADAASAIASVAPPSPEEIAADDVSESAVIVPRRVAKQEEARLVTYIRDALAVIYESDFQPESADHVFDVHNDRGGSDFENVDLLGFHWRSHEIVETIAVEAKLTFSARLIQQASNYQRFANRVWIALPCSSADELREYDERLFDFVVERGLGILGCIRRRGRSYEVQAIHWPRYQQVDPLERLALIERHRPTFEEAKVVAPLTHARFPKMR